MKRDNKQSGGCGRPLPYLQSSGLSLRRRRNLFCGRIRAKQQSRLAPGGNLGRSRISRPSATDSQLLCRATTWSGGESASRHTSRLPSRVSTTYFSFHCLNMKPPAAGIGGKKWSGIVWMEGLVGGLVYFWSIFDLFLDLFRHIQLCR